MHNEDSSKERWTRQATLGTSTGWLWRTAAEHTPSIFFVVRSLLMTFGLCSRGVPQWVVPAPVVQWGIASQWGVAVCPPSNQMSLLYRKMHTGVSLQEFLNVIQHYPLVGVTSTEACFRSCIFKSALHSFDFTLQLKKFMRVICRDVDMTLLLKQQPALQCL